MNISDIISVFFSIYFETVPDSLLANATSLVMINTCYLDQNELLFTFNIEHPQEKTSRLTVSIGLKHYLNQLNDKN